MYMPFMYNIWLCIYIFKFHGHEYKIPSNIVTILNIKNVDFQTLDRAFYTIDLFLPIFDKTHLNI